MILNDQGVSSSGRVAASRSPIVVSKNIALAPATRMKSTLAHHAGFAAYRRLGGEEEQAGHQVDREADERPRHEPLDRVDRHAAQHPHETAIEEPGDADEQAEAEEVQRLERRPQPLAVTVDPVRQRRRREPVIEDVHQLRLM